jgi:hypothetical protein
LHCRQSLAGRVAHDPLFAVPLQAIDWAVGHGVADRLYALLSLGHLVISNRGPRAKRADRLVLIPKPEIVELRVYRDSQLSRTMEVDKAYLGDELERLVSDFR